MLPKRLALIPARSGSKGVMAKNSRELAGRPLLLRARTRAREVDLVDRIRLSTDSEACDEVARAEGIDVPLEPTSPLRTPEIVREVPLAAEAEGWDAGVRSFVEPLSEQLETSEGERGARFSGGPRQRIALARALVRKPRLLILDEMTAGLDTETERDICAKVSSLAKDTAILVIPHCDARNVSAHRRTHLDDGNFGMLEHAVCA